MIKWPSSCVALCAAASSSFACIQTGWLTPPKDPQQLPADIFNLHVHIDAGPIPIEMTTLNGRTITLPAGKSTADPQTSYLSLIAQHEANPDAHTSSVDRNDYGAALLFAGRYADAVPVFVQLEKDLPGKYSTASNLGTAYELLGDDAKALEWIREGIARNVDSHEGTEWLHVAILEVKLKLKADPHWLVRHSVLEGHDDQSRASKEQALEYQLNERLYFIHSNDPIMCDLMYQAALVTQDPAKRSYFLRQVPRFGTLRDEQVRKLQGAR